MDYLLSSKGAGQFRTLIDVIETRQANIAGTAWWGPVIGADEGGTTDGFIDGFSVSQCLVDDDSSSASDRRLKEDITEVGTTVYGLPLYHFRYRDCEGVYEGVMADDVVGVKPSAVSRGEDGFLRVNYRSLGIEMRRLA